MTIRLIVTALLLALAASSAAEAQQAGKVARIGFLSPASSTSGPHILEAFRQGLRDLGYVGRAGIGLLGGQRLSLAAYVMVAGPPTERPRRRGLMLASLFSATKAGRKRFTLGSRVNPVYGPLVGVDELTDRGGRLRGRRHGGGNQSILEIPV